MCDFIGSSNGLRISDVKASVFETIKRMQKWRESQREEFESKQLMVQHQELLQTDKKSDKYYEQDSEIAEPSGLSENSITDQGHSGSCISFPDQSSINGHMINCFSDDSRDSISANKEIPRRSVELTLHAFSSLSDISSQNPSFEENNKNQDVNKTSNKPIFKRQFLKKGAGLERYKPKKKVSSTEPSKPSAEQKAKPQEKPQRKLVLKLKPVSPIQKCQKTNRVQFCEIPQVCDDETQPKELFKESNKSSSTHTSNTDIDSEIYRECNTCVDSDICINTENKDQENKELAEFEMLENCAQNSSFNSDSSIVQRVLNRENLKPYQNPSMNSNLYNQPLNYIRLEENSTKPKHFTSLEDDLDLKKQHLHHYISGIEPKIASLNNKVTNLETKQFEGNDSANIEMCSTPVKTVDNLSDYDSSENSSIISTILVQDQDTGKYDSFQEVDDRIENRVQDYFDEKTDIDLTKQMENDNQAQKNKSKLVEELEQEIKDFQAERARLAAISKERDMILKQLQKERDEFHKCKEDEIRKFNSEMESQKQQFKREKETFNRLKKVTKDYRNKKERDDLSTLKQEVEKLQKELKREKIKYNNDTRRLKSQLTAAEKERDTFKLENITLEDQIEDLVTTLKKSMALGEKPGVKVQSKGQAKTDKKNTDSHCNKVQTDSKNNGVLTKSTSKYKQEEVDTEPKLVSNTGTTKHKVRFDLSPQFEDDRNIFSDSGIVSNIENVTGKYFDLTTESSDEATFENLPYEEIQYDNRVERKYQSGDVEVVFSSGTRKYIGETTKVYYTNGDEKEIYPDNRTVYKFFNGVIEESIPNGPVITTFVNGQIQKQNPDKSKEVNYPDGSHLVIYPDRTQVITNVDGTKARIHPDTKTETIEFVNGEKEIRTETYKRREFPDGSVKIIYTSGRQETRYSNGQIRIKDKDGNLVVDTKHLLNLSGT